MGVFLSPGVITREIDMSNYPASTSTSVCAFIGTAKRGPVNLPTLITTPELFVQTFGEPTPASYLGYAALAYLEQGNQLWVSRVGASFGPDKLTKAEVTLKDGDYAEAIATLPGGAPWEYVFATDAQIRIKLNGTVEQTLYIDAGTYTADDLVTVINRQISGYAFAYKSTNQIAIRSMKKGALSKIEFVEIDNSKFLFDVLNVTAATVTSTNVSPFTITDVTNTLSIKINGSGAIPVTLTSGSRTATQIAGEISAAIASYGGLVTTPTSHICLTTQNSGSGTSIEFVSVDNSAYVALGFTADSPVSGTSTIPAGTTTTTDTLKVTAINEGTWGNDLNISIAGVTDISAGTGSSDVVEKFNITISQNGVVVENFVNCTFGLDMASDPNFVETVINGISKTITVLDMNTTSTTIFPADCTQGSSVGDMSGGKDGIQGVLDADYIGTEYDSSIGRATGIYAYDNPEKIDINIIGVPGKSSPAIIGELLGLCEKRADCMAIIDPPRGYAAREVVDWSNNVDGGGQALNSSYGALYHDWLEIYDSYNKLTVTVPPSGYIAGVYAKNDFLTDAWYAPAGLNRGRILTVIKTATSPTQGERDLMYGGTNAVNPIVNFITDGVTVWGQKTLLRQSTSLNRVNVRRLMLYLRKVAARTARSFLFEANTPALWNRVTGTFDALLSEVKSRGGVTAYKIQCDAVINTPERIDRNELWIRIFVKPTKAVEFIMVEFVLMPTGASLETETIV